NALVADPSYLGLMGQYVGTTTISLGGEWTDTSNDPPNGFNFSQISAEVASAALHFGDYGSNYTPNDIILVALPSGHNSNKFAGNGGPWCAYHNLAPGLAVANSGVTGPTPFIDLDYQPDDPSGCFANATNAFNDSFGHGIYDNVSAATGHEIAELLTDYDTTTGWYGPQGEIGDPCVSNFVDFGPPAGYPNNGFAVQPLWSNNNGGCALGPTGALSIHNPINFGTRDLGTVSATRRVSITNVGDADFYLGSGNPWVLSDNTGSFAISGDNCPSTLHPGQACGISVTFSPRTAGPLSAQLAFVGPTHINPEVSLSGTGRIQQFVNFAGKYDFGDSLTGQRKPGPIIQEKLTNTSVTKLKVGTVLLASGGSTHFSISKDGCKAKTLAPGKSCIVSVEFTPKALGALQVVLGFSTSAGKFGEILRGTGEGPIAMLLGETLKDGVLSFPPVEKPSAHEQESLTVLSRGREPLSLGDISVTGNFIQKNRCPGSLPVGHSCTIEVTLHASHYAGQMGALTIRDSGMPGTQKFKLIGDVEGTWADVNPGRLDFGQVPVGATTTKTVRLSNIEKGIDVKSIAVSGPFTETNDCPKTPLMGFCTISVSVHPSQSGKLHGNLRIATNGVDSLVAVPLTAVAQGAQPASTTTVTSNGNPSNYGVAVTFTATVTNTSDNQTPTGSVEFFDGDGDVGSGTALAGSGNSATSTISYLPTVGQHEMTATYTPTGNFGGSTSPVYAQTVNKAPTTTAVTSSLNPSAAGQDVTFTATLTLSVKGKPTGTVQFALDGNNYGSPQPISGRVATIDTQTYPLNAGDYTVTATYSGDSTFSGSASPGYTQTVNSAPTTTAVSSSQPYSGFGQDVTFTATVSSAIPDSFSPTGTVQFQIDGNNYGSPQQLSVPAETASIDDSNLSIGQHTVVAIYSGDSGFSGSTSAGVTQSVHAT
ncbi:MAG TPA: Ig-like domain repeat protein, partial [Chloroflexota bacterium]|nr:Ig-like domain repeat protein [Chloroflexota bacterium]